MTFRKNFVLAVILLIAAFFAVKYISPDNGAVGFFPVMLVALLLSSLVNMGGFTIKKAGPYQEFHRIAAWSIPTLPLAIIVSMLSFGSPIPYILIPLFTMIQAVVFYKLLAAMERPQTIWAKTLFGSAFIYATIATMLLIPAFYFIVQVG